MNKINYQQQMENIIKGLTYKPKLLLHCCCGPCASYVIECLKAHFDITLFWYNPNIHPNEEWDKRLKSLKLLAEHFALPVVVVDYNTDEYFTAVSGLENELEGGKRCKVCTNQRIEKTGEYAKNNGYEWFCTTLSISPLKDAQSLNEQGNAVQEKYGVKYLPSDFKKKGGYLRSIEMCKELNIYRQNYCGCIFAKEGN